ncbi:Acetyltransferase (GNAT) family [Turicibacter sanguinis]|nr:Acetyltransferase (GNAT) family [Turicibacter sanguinis]
MLALRYTKLEDIERVMEIIKQAQQYFKEKGINQWQNGYPNTKVIENDIKNGHSFVLIKNNEIVGTIAISFEGEATYNKIFEGAWKSNDNYAVIHRIAVDHELKGIGLSSEMIKQTELMCNKKSVGSIKVDTHEDNQAMQRSLIKNGFDYCGVIYLADGSKRVAFEKCL